MEESINGSHTDNTNRNRAREIFQRISGHMQNASNRGVVMERFVPSTETDGFSHEEGASTEKERSVQQHLISGVVFRWIERNDGNDWEFENVWDNVCVRQLDDIGQKPNYEWRPPNYGGQRNIQALMAENANIVLVRIIVDWSRLDGNVWSEQVVWSGSFADCHRILQLLEDDSNAANCIELIVEEFDVHCHLRERYIALHEIHPFAAAMAAVDFSPSVIIPVESIGTGDGEADLLICAICHDSLSTRDETKRLPCNHVFHGSCIFQWFYSKLECPLCRKEFMREVA